MRVAAVTMVYNEPSWLPVWIRHNASQVGAENCLVLDHGSDDGSTRNLPVRTLRLARGELDEAWRAQLLARVCARLLSRYDAVVHTDVDELLVADPARHASLAAYAAAIPTQVMTAFGLELHHRPDQEPALDLTRPILTQRSRVRFNAAMCKPALIRRAVRWAPGFHCADAPIVLDGLFMFHLRHADLALGLARLARTRALAVRVPAAHVHQQASDAAFEAMLRAVAGLPDQDAGPFDPAEPPLSKWTDALHASRAAREGQQYSVDLSLAGDVLWTVPERFCVF